MSLDQTPDGHGQQLLQETRERHFSLHHSLLHIAALELEALERKDVGSFNHALIAITLSALAVEALLNAVGDRAIRDWKDFERTSTRVKLRVLTDHLGVSINAGEPWQSLRWLGGFRDAVAHGKPESVVSRRVLTVAAREKGRFDAPSSKLEEEVTEGNAKRAVGAVYRLRDMLCEKVNPDLQFGLWSDGWSGSAAFVAAPPPPATEAP